MARALAAMPLAATVATVEVAGAAAEAEEMRAPETPETLTVARSSTLGATSATLEARAAVVTVGSARAATLSVAMVETVVAELIKLDIGTADSFGRSHTCGHLLK